MNAETLRAHSRSKQRKGFAFPVLHSRFSTLYFLCALGVSAFNISTVIAQQQDFSTVEIKATHVAGTVYMLEGAGGNIGVSVGPDGILIVDDQFAPLADRIRAALKKLYQNPPRQVGGPGTSASDAGGSEKLGEGKLHFVLNTHWHGDHTGGNADFGREAHIIAHENVRKRLMTRQEALGRVFEPLPKEGLPIITFDESLSVHFNGEEIHVVHYPHGHTDGDSVIGFSGSNVVHMGDLFFSGRFPFIDLDSGGDVEGYTNNIEAVMAKLPPGVKIIPGHGPLSTPDDLKTFHAMLVETTGIVRQRIAAGKTLEQIKGEGLPEKWKDWGTGFIKTDRWLEIVHRSLTRK